MAAFLFYVNAILPRNFLLGHSKKPYRGFTARSTLFVDYYLKGCKRSTTFVETKQIYDTNIGR